MSEKVVKEHCEDCGCPLDICCKPKEPVVSAEELEEYIDSNLDACANIDATNLLKWLRQKAGEKVKGNE